MHEHPTTRPRRPLFVAATLIAALVTLAAGQQKNLPATLRAPGPSPHAAPGVVFTDVTREAGLAGFKHISGVPQKDYIVEATGAGCAFLDFDGDGWLDVYLLNSSTFEALKGKAKHPRAALYRNNQNGTFTDVTERAGVANEAWGQGVCAGDFDNDGDSDLYVTNYGKNRLYRNNGDGTFTDIAGKAGVSVGGWSTGCAFGDYDGDGRLDLFVAGYIELDANKLPPPGSGGEGEAAKAGEKEKKAEGSMGAAYVAGTPYCQYRGRRVMCGPRGLKGAPDFLFRNNGDGTFTDVTRKAGVEDKPGYYGFGVAWFDADDDGKLDVIVANDSTPNYLYRNKGDGTFEDISYASGAALNEHGREQAHMGVAVGDYDGDTRLDIHITNFSDDSNVLYRNDGALNFTDVTFQARLGEATIPFLGWGTNFLDYDHDGWLDLFVANGHVYPAVDAADWGTSYKQRQLLFRNVQGKFYEVGSGAGAALSVPRSARGSAAGDFDNDGDLDLLLSNMDDAPTLLRNDGGKNSGRWLMLRLVGDPARRSPRDAVGASVFCTAAGRRMRGEVASGRSYDSQSDLRVHFGLGAATKVERLEVRWPSGETESFGVPGVDRLLTIEQGRGAAK
jgi:enediyne biosynthesis protein E4